MSFFFLLLYISAIYIRPQEWVPAVYAWPLIDILAALTLFALLLERMGGKRMRINKPQNVLLLWFLVSVVLSHIAHTYAWGAYDSFLQFGRNVVMFFLFVNALDSVKKLKISIWLIIFLTVILAIQGSYQFKTGVGWAGQPMTEASSDSPSRITWIGIFNDPNDLALAFVVAVGLLLSLVFNRTKFLLKVICISLMAVLMQSLYLTNSRGGYLALAATTAYFFMRKMRNKFIAFLIAGILAFTVIIVGPSRLSGLSAQEESAKGRIEAWYEGFQMLKSSPLFGVGYGMFTDEYPLTAHNSFILVAAEEGLFGLFIWVALIYASFKVLNILAKKNFGLKPYISGLEAGLLGFLSASYFLSRSYIPLLYILLALACAFGYTLLKKEDYVFTAKDARLAGFLSMTILFLVWISMRVSLRLMG